MQQETLLGEVISQLPLSEHKAATKKRSRVKVEMDNALSDIDTDNIQPIPATDGVETADSCEPSSPTDVEQSPCYLGEVSDIRFVHVVKQFLQSQDGTTAAPTGLESYDQGDGAIVSDLEACKGVLLPALEEAKPYIDAYFSTIHVAYPFIPQALFIEAYQTIGGPDTQSACSRGVKTALTYTVCAIGAYYTSLLGHEEKEDMRHEKYFSTALRLAPTATIERSVTQISLLLARCFYLLVVCRTESCWTMLGQAVRAAQSIGLHVETDATDNPTEATLVEVEKRRRLWYSIYVLDRLLALQLGRPPAIHDDDYNVPLPSRVSDANIDWRGTFINECDTNGPSEGDYFLAVIAFSEIVGRVLRSLYCPKRRHITSEDLLNTKDLDGQLSAWKLELPRSLRFDLGHAFEQSSILKRQRNMLAIKYHHLRALIHRPYLCHPLLMSAHDSDSSGSELDWSLARAYEKICIMEARETARLLHSISSKKDLVSDFPWWQMISCLVCASSILLVSGILAQTRYESFLDFDTTSLYDDAETCLKVFDALSIKSPGARIARDMMKALRECGIRWSTSDSMGRHNIASGTSTNPEVRRSVPEAYSQITSIYSSEFDQLLGLSGAPITSNCYWPTEIVDSMTWSAQFFDPSPTRQAHTTHSRQESDQEQ
ncbi:hypothetical protein VHEMI07196 [[Torrubiella] hemipterigena]|nr:hypothetical protein VHEMI07196 [[Torrubiella] hemipterigena]